jgi:hypothetical protein
MLVPNVNPYLLPLPDLTNDLGGGEGGLFPSTGLTSTITSTLTLTPTLMITPVP